MDLTDTQLTLLEQGEITSCDLTAAGSNYTFLVELRLDQDYGYAIYKPQKGEIPLWDFPSGTLYKRECAAYVLSEILGWNFIPYTLIREGPHGIGSVQHYVEHDPKENYYALDGSTADQLKQVACFDLVANNTDRKAAHVLKDPNGKLWGIDQGLTFHADTKIRTVIWDFAGDPIPDHLLEGLLDFMKSLESPNGRVLDLLELLLPEEITSLHRRIEWVLGDGSFPGLPGRRRG